MCFSWRATEPLHLAPQPRREAGSSMMLVMETGAFAEGSSRVPEDYVLVVGTWLMQATVICGLWDTSTSRGIGWSGCVLHAILIEREAN